MTFLICTEFQIIKVNGNFLLFMTVRWKRTRCSASTYDMSVRASISTPELVALERGPQRAHVKSKKRSPNSICSVEVLRHS